MCNRIWQKYGKYYVTIFSMKFVDMHKFCCFINVKLNLPGENCRQDSFSDFGIEALDV